MSPSSFRLFVDMDGTLARFHDEARYLERMFEPKFFRNLAPFAEAVEDMRIFANMPEWEVYILSAVLPGVEESVASQKNAWLNEHLPEIDLAHRIYPPMGEDKTRYIPGGIGKSDILLDDYNKNLTEWQAAGGTAVKFVNNINDLGLVGPRWQGLRLRYDDDPACAVEFLLGDLDALSLRSIKAPAEDLPRRRPHL